MAQLRSNFSRLLLPLGSALLALAPLLTGCSHTHPTPPPAGSYFGPTDSLDELLTKINANNQLLPTLWSRLSYEIVINDPKTDKTHTYTDDFGGTLQYRAPGELRLRLNKTGLGLVFDLGLNPERYWLVSLAPDAEQIWYGQTKRLRPGEPSELPIAPDSVLQVLAIGSLNADLRALPAPTLRFNNDADAYMLTWVAPTADRMVILREIWYDRATLHPILVLLFDHDGRAVLRAYLRKHQPLNLPSVPVPPEVATEYDLFFPETRSRMLLHLKDPVLTYKNAPDDRSFRFPGTDMVPSDKVKQVDAQNTK